MYLLIPTRGLAQDTGLGLPRLDGDSRVVAAADVHDVFLATPLNRKTEPANGIR